MYFGWILNHRRAFVRKERGGGLGWPGSGGAGSLQGVHVPEPPVGNGALAQALAVISWVLAGEAFEAAAQAMDEARSILGIVIWRPSCRGKFLEPRMT